MALTRSILRTRVKTCDASLALTHTHAHSLASHIHGRNVVTTGVAAASVANVALQRFYGADLRMCAAGKLQRASHAAPGLTPAHAHTHFAGTNATHACIRRNIFTEHRRSTATSVVPRRGMSQWAYTYRDMTCGDASVADVGRSVRMAGYVQTTRMLGSIMFIVLRDAYGTTQIVVDTSGDATKAGASGVSGVPSLATIAASLGHESIIQVEGSIRARSQEGVNPHMHTGAVEVVAERITVLARPAMPLPFQVQSGRGDKLAAEDVRLKYRYLDLRREALQRNLRLRSVVTHAIRTCLHTRSPAFVEVDTPTLFRSTPEGAREFLVPTRQRGKFYALTQSPQQYKQLLMTGGIDRYFQIARCYRDESGRADRQPEFTQVDIEMSFVSGADVMHTAEAVLSSAVTAASTCHLGDNPATRIFRDAAGGRAKGFSAPQLMHPTPLPRMTFAHAMATYGVDKPDRRLGLPIAEVSSVVQEQISPESMPKEFWTELRASALSTIGAKWTPQDDRDLVQFATARPHVRAFVAPKLGAALSRKDLTTLTDEIKATLPPALHGSLALPIMIAKVEAGGQLKGNPALSGILTLEGQSALADAMRASAGDIIVLVAGNGMAACQAAGVARMIVAEACRIKGVPLLPHGTSAHIPADEPIVVAQNLRHRMPSAAGTAGAPANAGMLDAFWVTDFPLFESAEGATEPASLPLQSSHHPFTSPLADDIPLLLDVVAGKTPRSELLTVRGLHYDLVINGTEVAGGSIRIHDPQVQLSVLRDVLRVSETQLSGFSTLLNALSLGTPPHGGIAFGLDRLVAILAGPESVRSLRDVIAFPKSATGNELMTDAPATVTPAQLAEYGIALA